MAINFSDSGKLVDNYRSFGKTCCLHLWGR